MWGVGGEWVGSGWGVGVGSGWRVGGVGVGHSVHRVGYSVRRVGYSVCRSAAC